MDVAEDVRSHIHDSLLDLRRRLERETVLQIARAVLAGASDALSELAESEPGPAVEERAFEPLEGQAPKH